MYDLSLSPWLMNTCIIVFERIIWKLRVFWFTYSARVNFCRSTRFSRSSTRPAYATGSGHSSSSSSAADTDRHTTSTGALASSCLSGPYH